MLEEDEVKKEAEELYNNLCRIAELASKRKLTRGQRNAYIHLFRIAALTLLDASETGLSGHLNLAKTIIRSCEVGLLSEEEGEGRKIEVPKLSDIKISQSERVKILQQLRLEEKQAHMHACMHQTLREPAQAAPSTRSRLTIQSRLSPRNAVN